MFVAAGSGAPTTLVVVAYGATPRLRRCVESLVGHESDHEFEVACVVNPDSRDGAPEVPWMPTGVDVLLPEMNLGWGGGLHLARTRLRGTYMGWVQDDMEPRAGWLDALVAAAENHPDVAVFGAVSTDDFGSPDGVAGGWARPAGVVREWNETDPTRVDLPEAVTEFDWVTSKGSLQRLSVWDEIGGPEPRLFPLNHVDKEYCTHLRAHGWRVALVPEARLKHAQSQSAPSLFRGFLNDWQEPWFDRSWGPVAEALVTSKGRAVAHSCHGRWTLDEVERACAIEASRMVVPFSRWATEFSGASLDLLRDDYESSTSWRITGPLRALGRLRGRARA